MTKYELYQILDENGFEPSEENLDILTEGLDCGDYLLDEDGVLYEWRGGLITKAIGAIRGHKMARLQHKADEAEVDPTKKGLNDKQKQWLEDKKKKLESGKGMLGGQDNIADTFVKTTQKYKDQAEKEHAKTLKKVNDTADRNERVKSAISGAREASERRKSDLEQINANGGKKIKVGEDGNAVRRADDSPEESTDVPSKSGKRTHKVVTKEKGSDYKKGDLVFTDDYNLYKLLDINGFEPTNENLEILKEELENGNTVILSLGEVSLNESMGDDDIFAQILVENGFKVNENNLKVLAEAIENGHVLLEEKEPGEEVDLTDKESGKKKGERVLTDTGKKVLKTAAIMAGMTVLGGAAGAGAGYGIGKGVSAGAAKGTEAAANAAAEKATEAGTKAAEAANKVKEAEAGIKDATSADAYQAAKGEQAAADAAKTKADHDAAVAEYAKKGFNSNTGKKIVTTTSTVAGGAAGAAGGAVAGAVLAKKANGPKKEKAEKK